ncbi:hypothetical protein D0962_27640 [Leptolyngbyaceae cyanobacterium CCMR0082]|uniref:PsbP C-terminal domain-containing protein n=2 Tax=Adonisia turfae TaxID=2950184 RepID=A0A6M0SDA7_9CYAN|nr:hypothetical protein [Adonisia turfae]MDV3350211.1 hypothetical protein [Leptothoe sp. LEGE 181152]NEZ55735.1 hypothetical protein [Adonisia turfae CCMR0081]NEZ66487.1 hypothetical protein [Adonisia turfae CCMR0082]
MADVLHFFSHQTHVSLELPVGWEEFSEDAHNVVYYYEIYDEDEDEDDFSKNPRLIIQLFPSPSTNIDNLRQASESVVTVPRKNFELISHQEEIIDQYPGLTDVFRYFDEDFGALAVRYQSFILVDNVLFSFAGACLAQHEDELLPMFRNALESIRFIFMTQAV